MSQFITKPNVFSSIYLNRTLFFNFTNFPFNFTIALRCPIAQNCSYKLFSRTKHGEFPSKISRFNKSNENGNHLGDSLSSVLLLSRLSNKNDSAARVSSIVWHENTENSFDKNGTTMFGDLARWLISRTARYMITKSPARTKVSISVFEKWKGDLWPRDNGGGIFATVERRKVNEIYADKGDTLRCENCRWPRAAY